MTIDERSGDLSQGEPRRKLATILLGVTIALISVGIVTIGTIIDVNVLAANIGIH